MTHDDTAAEAGDADFQRWFFGGSPPESDDWSRHAFEDSLQGAAVGIVPSTVAALQRPGRSAAAARFAAA